LCVTIGISLSRQIFFTQEEALRMAKVVPGLSAIFVVYFKRGESVKLMKFDEDGLLEEPCLWCCDETECIYMGEGEEE